MVVLLCSQSLQEQLKAVEPVIRRAEELLHETDQLTSANTTDATAAAAAERRRYDTLMQRYRDIVGNVTRLISVTAEFIHKRDNLRVSCRAASLSYW